MWDKCTNKFYANANSDVDSYFRTNMDFLDPEIRRYFFKEYPDIYSRVDDHPPAKYNVGASIKNSLVSSGSSLLAFLCSIDKDADIPDSVLSVFNCLKVTVSL